MQDAYRRAPAIINVSKAFVIYRLLFGGVRRVTFALAAVSCRLQDELPATEFSMVRRCRRN